MEKIVLGLKNYWFLIIALVTMSVAWGQSQTKINSLEEAMKQNLTTQVEVHKLRTQIERFDERTKALYESQARQERMIEMMLMNQRTMIKEVRK